MSKKVNKNIVITIGIGILEVLIGIIGLCFFYSAVVDNFENSIPPILISELPAYRAREAGIIDFYFLWGLLYMVGLPVGNGMIARREWARKATLWFLPLSFISSFPFIFVDYRIHLRKLDILFSFSKIVEADLEFWPLLLKAIVPWVWFMVIVCALTYRLRTYLQRPLLKTFFR